MRGRRVRCEKEHVESHEIEIRDNGMRDWTRASIWPDIDKEIHRFTDSDSTFVFAFEFAFAFAWPCAWAVLVLSCSYSHPSKYLRDIRNSLLFNTEFVASEQIHRRLVPHGSAEDREPRRMIGGRQRQVPQQSRMLYLW